jgi:acyl-CoA thioesterase-2
MSLLPNLIEIIQLEQIDDFTYMGNSLDIGSLNVYGGQVLAQALYASNQLISGTKTLHSTHCYFLNPGNISIPIEYRIENLKNGKAFSTNRVVASQKGRDIFILAASYHIKEEGINHSAPMPNVSQPESLTSFSEIFAQLAGKFDIEPRGIFSEQSPMIFHPVHHYDPFNPGIRPPMNYTWFKANGKLPEISVETHQLLMAYASDFNLLITALFPHNMSFFTHPMQIASLDHAMWFHHETKADDWHLYHVESSIASGGRAFCTGKIFTNEGKLVASVVQEGLIRKIGKN